jgi:hypothetical protein
MEVDEEHDPDSDERRDYPKQNQVRVSGLLAGWGGEGGDYICGKSENESGGVKKDSHKSSISKMSLSKRSLVSEDPFKFDFLGLEDMDFVKTPQNLQKLGGGDETM